MFRTRIHSQRMPPNTRQMHRLRHHGFAACDCPRAASLSMASAPTTPRASNPASTFYIPAAGLTELQWEVAFTIYVLRDCSLPVVGKYLEQLSSECFNVLKEALVLRFLHADMGVLTTMSAGSRDNPSHHAAARRWLVEYDLTAWVTQLNEAVGIAPTARDVYEKYVSLLQSAGLPVPYQEGTESWKRWVRRWKQKWHARHGVVATQEGEYTQHLLEKAPIESPETRSTRTEKQAHDGLVFESQN